MAPEPIDARPSRTPETEAALLDAALAEVLAHGDPPRRRHPTSPGAAGVVAPDALSLLARCAGRLRGARHAGAPLGRFRRARSDPVGLDALVAAAGRHRGPHPRRMPLSTGLRDTDPELFAPLHPRRASARASARSTPSSLAQQLSAGRRRLRARRRARGGSPPWCCSSRSPRCSRRRSWRSGCPPSRGGASCRGLWPATSAAQSMTARIVGRHALLVCAECRVAGRELARARAMIPSSTCSSSAGGDHGRRTRAGCRQPRSSHRARRARTTSPTARAAGAPSSSTAACATSHRASSASPTRARRRGTCS